MKKRTGWRRTLAGILAVLAIAAYAPTIAAGFLSGGTAIVAHAEGEISYRTWDDAAKKLVEAAAPCTNYTTVEDDAIEDEYQEWGAADTTTWYVVSEDTTIEDRINVTGDVHLILCDDATLTAKHGIRVVEGNSLTIYGQQEGNGMLIANTESKTYKGYPSIMSYSEEIDDFNAGIGGDENETCGTVTINGGDISAYAGIDGSGIGGGNEGDGGTVIINGGKVYAFNLCYYDPSMRNSLEMPTGHHGSDGYAGGTGIGGGVLGAGGTVIINGGAVDAFGGRLGSGIGGGWMGDGGTVTINGGIVNANGGEYIAIGIGGATNNGDNGDLILGKGMKLYGGNVADPTNEVELVDGDYARSRYMTVRFPVLNPGTLIEFDEDGEYYFTPYTSSNYLLLKSQDTSSFSETNNCLKIEGDELVYYKDNERIGAVADIPDYFTGTALASISGSFFSVKPNSFYTSALSDTSILNQGDILTPGASGQFETIQIDGVSTVFTNANIEVQNGGLFENSETTIVNNFVAPNNAYVITSRSSYGSDYSLRQTEFNVPTDLSDAALTMTENSADIVSVVLGETALTEGTDYQVIYKKDGVMLPEKPTAIGDYTAVIRGINTYSGRRPQDFSILPTYALTLADGITAKRGDTALTGTALNAVYGEITLSSASPFYLKDAGGIVAFGEWDEDAEKYVISNVTLTADSEAVVIENGIIPVGSAHDALMVLENSLDIAMTAQLTADISGTDEEYYYGFTTNSNRTLDLNGHTFDNSGVSQYYDEPYVNGIYSEDGTLTIIDSSDEGNGKLINVDDFCAMQQMNEIDMKYTFGSIVIDGGIISCNTMNASRKCTIIISGGTFTRWGNYDDKDDTWNDLLAKGYAVQEVKQGEDTVYVVKKDFSQAVVTVDTVNQSASVQIDNKDVPADEYTLTFGKDAETASEKFPSDPGEYYAFATAKDTSKTYVGMAQSASFSIADEDKIDAQSVIDLINAITDFDSLEEFGQAIAAAKEAYNQLTEKQKSYVTNYTRLTNAEALYAEALKEKKDFSQAIITVNSTDGTVSVTLDGNVIDPKEYTLTYGINKATATKTPPTKPGDYYIFATAKEDSENYIGTAQSALYTITDKDVIDVIAKINAIAACTSLKEIGDAISAARTAYNALTDEQKANVTNATFLEAAERIYGELLSALDKAAKDAAKAAQDLADLQTKLKTAQKEAAEALAAKDIADQAAAEAQDELTKTKAKLTDALAAAEQAAADAETQKKAAEEAAENLKKAQDELEQLINDANATAEELQKAKDAVKEAEEAKEKAEAEAATAQENAKKAADEAEKANKAKEKAEADAAQALADKEAAEKAQAAAEKAQKDAEDALEAYKAEAAEKIAAAQAAQKEAEEALKKAKEDAEDAKTKAAAAEKAKKDAEDALAKGAADAAEKVAAAQAAQKEAEEALAKAEASAKDAIKKAAAAEEAQARAEAAQKAAEDALKAAQSEAAEKIAAAQEALEAAEKAKAAAEKAAKEAAEKAAEALAAKEDAEKALAAGEADAKEKIAAAQEALEAAEKAKAAAEEAAKESAKKAADAEAAQKAAEDALEQAKLDAAERIAAAQAAQKAAEDAKAAAEKAAKEAAEKAAAALDAQEAAEEALKKGEADAEEKIAAAQAAQKAAEDAQAAAEKAAKESAEKAAAALAAQKAAEAALEEYKSEATEKIAAALAAQKAAEEAKAAAEKTAKEAADKAAEALAAEKAAEEALEKEEADAADKVAAAEAARKAAEEAQAAAEKSAKESAEKAAAAEAAQKAAEEALEQAKLDAAEKIAAAQAAQKAAEEALTAAEKSAKEAAEKAAEALAAEQAAKEALEKGEEDATEKVAAAEAARKAAEDAQKQADADKTAAEQAAKDAADAQEAAEAAAKQAEADKAAADLATAKKVIDKIKAIGKVKKTNDCENAIIAARSAYDTLNDDQKALVTNYDVLQKAEAAYKLLPQTGTTGTPNVIAAMAVLMGLTGVALVRKSRKDEKEAE